MVYSLDYRPRFRVTPTSLAAAASYIGCPARREVAGYWIGTGRGPTAGEPHWIPSGTRTGAWPKVGPSCVLSYNYAGIGLKWVGRLRTNGLSGTGQHKMANPTLPLARHRYSLLRLVTTYLKGETTRLRRGIKRRRCNLFLRMSVEEFLDPLKTWLNRRRAGEHRQLRGITIGISFAILSVVIGLLLGPILNRVIPFHIAFETGELDLVWGVHATVISLSLVGLSFAWSSIRDLPTTRDIVDEIIFRLRSLETISYLLTSNLCIGAVILVSDGEFVTSGLAWSIGFLLVGSFSIVVIRFMRVLELLLHSSLDNMVSTFAEDSLNGKSGRENQDYIIYVEHFLSAAQRSIENDRPEDLRGNLRQIEDLMSDLLFSEGSGYQETWKETLRNYEALHRWSVREQNPTLEKKVISSLHGLDLTISRYDYHHLSNITISQFATFLEQGFEYRDDPAVEHLLNRFKYAHDRIVGEFESADDLESLEVTESYVENLFEVYTRLWRTSVENESRKAIDYLEYLLDDIHQFQPYNYRKTVFIGPIQPLLYHKRNDAESYQKEISLLKFASYGWGLRLYKDGDLSEEFLTELFSKLNDNFQSPGDLSEIYIQAINENQLLRYWEQWNLEREMEDSHGAVMTGMSVDTWLLEFYCVSIVSYLERKNSGSLPEPEDSSFVENEISQHHIEKVIGMLKSYRDNYPADFLIDQYPSIEIRCDVLIAHFEDIKEALNEQRIEEIREQPISDDEVERFEDHVNSQFEKCILRKGIEFTNEISEDDSDDFEEVTRIEYRRRHPFVESDIPTHYTSTHLELIDESRQFILDRLDLEKTKVDLEDLPDELEGVSAGVIVAKMSDVVDRLRDDERSERAHNDEIRSFFEFNGIPVMRDNTEKFGALALFEGDLEYTEPNKERPITVEVIPGENVDEIDEERVRGEVEDLVKVEYTYRAKIESQGPNGILIRVSS